MPNEISLQSYQKVVFSLQNKELEFLNLSSQTCPASLPYMCIVILPLPAIIQLGIQWPRLNILEDVPYGYFLLL